MIYGVKLNLRFIAEKTGCPPDIIMACIRKQGFGPEICED
jgi:hypothetical protein